MKKPLTAAAAAFAATLAATPAPAQDSGVTADDCITDLFVEIAAQLADIKVSGFVLVYEGDSRAALIEHCEKETGTTSQLFRAAKEVRYSARGVTIEIR